MKLEKKYRLREVLLLEETRISPLYFPSISSISNKFDINSLIELIFRSKYPYLLVSAYDIYNQFISIETREKFLNNYSNKIGMLILDSGIFEAYWRQDTRWVENSYNQVKNNLDCNYFTTFDISSGGREKSQNNSSIQHEKVIQIIHGSEPASLIRSVKDIIEKNRELHHIYAIPERECGITLSERAKTISHIREILDEGKRNILLHILGCGNPVSMALYSYVGADIFDSRDWMRHLFDPTSFKLSDISHIELLECDCVACQSPFDKSIKILLHNLHMYQLYTSKLRELIRANELEFFIRESLGIKFIV